MGQIAWQFALIASHLNTNKLSTVTAHHLYFCSLLAPGCYLLMLLPYKAIVA